jgi:hypothetical protein
LGTVGCFLGRCRLTRPFVGETPQKRTLPCSTMQERNFV